MPVYIVDRAFVFFEDERIRKDFIGIIKIKRILVKGGIMMMIIRERFLK